MNRDREIGVSLGAFIRSHNPSTRQIHAYLADVVTEEDLLVPLREVVSRPGFKVLRDFVGTGKGRIEKKAFLSDLQNTYVSAVTNRIESVLDGLLGLSETKNIKKQRDPISKKWILLLIAIAAIPGLVFIGIKSVSLLRELAVSQRDSVSGNTDTKSNGAVANEVPPDVTPPKIESAQVPSPNIDTDEVLVSELISRCKENMHLIKQLDSRQDLYQEAFLEEMGLFWSHVRSLGLQKAGTPIHTLLNHMDLFPTVKAHYVADIEKAKIANKVLEPYYADFDTTEQMNYRLETWLTTCTDPPAETIVKQWREGEVTYPFVKRT